MGGELNIQYIPIKIKFVTCIWLTMRGELIIQHILIKIKFFLPVYDWQWEESWIFEMLLSKSASDVVLKLLLRNLK